MLLLCELPLFHHNQVFFSASVSSCNQPDVCMLLIPSQLLSYEKMDCRFLMALGTFIDLYCNFLSSRGHCSAFLISLSFSHLIRKCFINSTILSFVFHSYCRTKIKLLLNSYVTAANFYTFSTFMIACCLNSSFCFLCWNHSGSKAHLLVVPNFGPLVWTMFQGTFHICHLV